MPMRKARKKRKRRKKRRRRSKKLPSETTNRPIGENEGRERLEGKVRKQEGKLFILLRVSEDHMTPAV